MPTIVITQSLGEAIRHLQSGWWLSKVKRGRHGSTHYYWLSETSEDGNIHTEAEEFVMQLEKLKLIEGARFDRNQGRRFYRHTRRVHDATEACRNFKLPPEEFWIPDEQPLHPS
jgi:hypothetical protein